MSKNTQQSGTVTVYVIVIMGILSIVIMGLVTFVFAQIRYSFHQVARVEALQMAESGVHFYRWYLAHQTDGKTASQIDDFWSGGSAYGILSPYDGVVSNRGKYRITVIPPQHGQTSVIIRSDGWVNRSPDVVRTVEVRFRRPSWSEFAIISDSDTRFGSGTTVMGPIHSNGGIRFDGVAHNVVSSARETYTDPDTGSVRDGVWTNWSNEYNISMNSDVFLAGKDFPVPSMDFTGIAADIALMRSEAQGTGRYFDGSGYGRHIILRTDSTFEVRTVYGYSTVSNDITSESAGAIYAIPNNSVIYIEDNAWVEGMIDGIHVTIVAADHSGATTPNIFIGHDIMYSSYDGSDIIGLIAGGDVEILRSSEDDLRIDAAVLAQTGRVGRQHYGWYCTAWQNWLFWRWCVSGEWDIKDTITVYGAIASNKRYGFAWTDGTGYTNRDLIYDNNLLYTPPPLFPTGTHYVPDLWKEL